MKNIIITALILLTLSCKAQTIVPLSTSSFDAPDENVYYKDLNNDLDKFTGTWKYINGSTEFTVIFEKSIKVDLDDDYYADMLSGWFKYQENGLIIANTLNMMPIDRQIIMGSTLNDDASSVGLHFYDPERPKMGVYLDIDYIEPSANGEQPKITWNLYLTALSPKLPGESEPLTDFRVPTSLTLTKQ